METVTGICRLHRDTAQLVRSHIIPEFLFTASYDDRHKAIQLKLNASKFETLVQKGLREPLLCAWCESIVNDRYEKPFRRDWLEAGIVPSVAPAAPLQVRVDYATFKLFHLLVLWRASVSTLEQFDQVQLGPHEERIRQMLIAGDPGKPNEYPIAGLFLDVSGEANQGLVICSSRGRIARRTAYATGYGGVYWLVFVDSNIPENFSRFTLRADGELILQSKKLVEMDFVQEFMQRLRAGRDDAIANVRAG